MLRSIGKLSEESMELFLVKRSSVYAVFVIEAICHVG